MAYWRDVGTLESYYEAHMDLCGMLPALNLYSRRWPIRTASYPDPCAKFSYDANGISGYAIGSMISGGCILAGGVVRNSILGRNVRIYGGATVEGSILMDNCTVGPRAQIRRTILDENVVVPDGAIIGFDLLKDRISHFVTESGLVIVTAESNFQR